MTFGPGILLAAATLVCGVWEEAGNPLPTTRQIVGLADVIAVVRAPDAYSNQQPHGMTSSQGVLSFEVVRLLRGSLAARVDFPGTLVDVDDYNEGVVPYRAARGVGACFAMTYRPGAYYLVFLVSEGATLTPYWQATAPTTEQLAPPCRRDPWCRWVRGRACRGQR
jgi:hypothetical protein